MNGEFDRRCRTESQTRGNKEWAQEDSWTCVILENALLLWRNCVIIEKAGKVV
jgi:hypothetical protein